MKNIRKEWLYPASIKEAIRVQIDMAKQVCTQDHIGSLEYIGGMDVSCKRFDPEKKVYASCVVLSSASLEVIERASIVERQDFPYIPGLLAFREAPSLIHAYDALKQKPDIIMIDGQGICHPRGLGIASHIGVLLDCPTIGVAKTILIGEPKKPLGQKAGSRIPLFWKGKIVAMLVRTKENCKPMIVSPGHKISLETSVKLVLGASFCYRLPEPTRQAHLAANLARKHL